MADNNNKNKKKNDKKFLIIFPILIIAIIASFVVYSHFEKKEDEKLSYDKLMVSLQKNEVEKLEMETGSTAVKVVLKGEKPEKERTETVNVPSLQAFMEWVNEKIDNKEIEVELIQNSPNAFIGVLENVFAYLPTILLITLIILIFKMQGLRW